MTPEEAAEAVKDPIGGFGVDWMFALGSYQPGLDAGYGLTDLYVRGRAGVMGDVGFDVVTEEMAIFGEPMISLGWPTDHPVDEAVELYARACADAGRARFADPEAAEAATLAGRVVDGAAVDHGPLFEGWRRLPVPADGPGAAAHQFNALRELRFAHHLAALREVDLSPVRSLLYRSGEGTAQLFGHTDLPEVTEDEKARWARAEARTAELTAPAFAVLDDRERQRFVELVHALLG